MAGASATRGALPGWIGAMASRPGCLSPGQSRESVADGLQLLGQRWRFHATAVLHKIHHDLQLSADERNRWPIRRVGRREWAFLHQVIARRGGHNPHLR